MFGGRIVRMRSRRRRNAAAREAMTYACNKKMRSNIGPVGRLTEIRFASKQNLQNSVVSTFGVGRCNKARGQKNWSANELLARSLPEMETRRSSGSCEGRQCALPRHRSFAACLVDLPPRPTRRDR